ncbi:MAG: SAM-dependent methyltransferase [Myxococcota bacterium]|jgi:SAM-dependent methyltransferase
MDILTALSNDSNYSNTTLQGIITAWVVSGAFERRKKISASNGDVSEDDYTKQSIYSLLYAVYRSVGTVKAETGKPYEFTFNTWGYTWPKEWDANTTRPDDDPQRFGKNAYTGLFQAPIVKEAIAKADGKVHVVEMGCGTGAGAHHICSQVLPKCTYEAVDMQQAAISTANRKFVPELNGRMKATCCDATKLPNSAESADFVVVCETHVTEYDGLVSDEDKAFFGTALHLLKPGGFLVWGNAIPDSTWQPCFDYLESVGMKKMFERDVTEEAVEARIQDAARVDAYVDQVLKRFHGFKIPKLGSGKRREAELAIKNFYRHPGTRLYEKMTDDTDSYKVVAFQKTV